MSQGFIPINNPLGHPNTFAEEDSVAVSHKQEDEEEDIGDQEGDETTLSKPVNNTPKKRAPKAAAVDENGQPLPKVPRKKAEPKLDAEGNPIPKAPRKKPEPKLDAEGNPINKAARKKPEPKLDAEGNPIPKPPRKPAVKKTKAEPKIEDDEDADMSMVVDMASASAAAGNGTQTDGVMHNGTFIAYARPEKPNGSSNGGSVAGGGDGGGLTVLEAKEAKEAAEKAAEVALKNAATVKDPATPAKAKKGPAKARINSPDGGVAVTPASKRKRGVKALANQDGEDAGTPTKKKKANALPTCRAELNDADKLLLDMKKAGKTWAEIVPQWAKLSGIEPQKSTLSVRYSRIMANLTEWKDGDIEVMLFAKEEITRQITDDINAMRKQKEAELWGKMADLMSSLGCDKYSGAAIEKAFVKEKKEDFPHKNTIEEVLAARRGEVKTENADGEDAGSADEGNSDGGAPVKGNEQDTEMNGDGVADHADDGDIEMADEI